MQHFLFCLLFPTDLFHLYYIYKVQFSLVHYLQLHHSKNSHQSYKNHYISWSYHIDHHLLVLPVLLPVLIFLFSDPFYKLLDHRSFYNINFLYKNSSELHLLRFVLFCCFLLIHRYLSRRLPDIFCFYNAGNFRSILFHLQILSVYLHLQPVFYRCHLC